MEANEPINRAEGKEAQAQLEAETAASIREAITTLTEADYEPSEEDIGQTFDPETMELGVASGQQAAAILDSVAGGYVGKVVKDEEVVGRIDIEGDGSAAVYVGAAGAQIVGGDGGKAFGVAAGGLVDALLKPADAPSESGELGGERRAMLIQALIKVGGRLWEKHGKSRIYFDPADAMGLSLSYYGTGNVSHATLGAQRDQQQRSSRVSCTRWRKSGCDLRPSSSSCERRTRSAARKPSTRSSARRADAARAEEAEAAASPAPQEPGADEAASLRASRFRGGHRK